MTLNFPHRVRAAIYIIVVLGTATVVPLHSFDILSDVVLAVWSSISGAASFLAALNVTPDQ